MLKIKANFNRKEERIYAQDCVVEKVIELSGEQFDAFSNNLLADRDFIKNNRELMYYDADGAAHCLLVIGEGRENGVLTQAEGYGYPRYTALVPHARSILTLGRYPALAGLCQKLTDMADYIVREGVKLKPGDTCTFVSMDDLEAMSGIDVARNTAIVSALCDMLGDRPEIADWEIDRNEFIITPQAPTLEQGSEQEHGPMMGM